MNEEEFGQAVTNLVIFLCETRGLRAGVDTAVGVLYGAFLSQEFPEWWQRFASVPKLRQLINESGVDVEGMRQECLDAFIDPKPQPQKERTVPQWRN